MEALRRWAFAATLLLCPSHLSAGRIGRIHTPPSLDEEIIAHSPTEQPPTLGQDELRCGFLVLPERVVLAPRLTDFVKKSGVWESIDSGTFAEWGQYSFAWDDTTTYISIGPKLFVKFEPSLRVDDEYIGVTLPADPNGEFGVVLLKDCDGILMYILRFHLGIADFYQIYNSLGQLVASSLSGDHYPDQMRFHDEDNIAIATAQSPAITVETMEEGLHFKREPLGTPEPWEVWFVGSSYGSNSSLTLSQNRWVIAAAVQHKAIRAASLAEGISYAHYVFELMLVAIIVGVLLLAYSLLSCLNRFVFSEPKKTRQKAAGNPFVEGTYGTAA